MIIQYVGEKTISEKQPFEAVYRENYHAIFRYLKNKVGNIHDAEDLTTEVFLYCYQNYEQYDVLRSSVATWLFLVANSRLKNYYRDKKEHIEFSELEEQLFTDNPDMDQAAWLEELRRILGEKLVQLSDRQRRVIVMRFFQQKEFNEIAARLNTTPGNVRVILSRALDRLEKEFSIIKEDWSF